MKASLSVRFGSLVGGAFLVLIAFGVYARTGVDYAALVEKHEQRTHGSKPRPVPALARFHAGTPPCTTWSEAATISQEELEQLGRDLRGAQLLARMRELEPLLVRWGKDDEARRHGPVSDAELLAAWDESGSPMERALARFETGDLTAALRAREAEAEAALAAHADERKRALGPHELEALYGIWMRHPRAMSPPALALTLARLAPP